MEAQVERRLAAILAADMVGFSRQMAFDEAGTFARLDALRNEIIDPKIAARRGRIVKTTGDGLLVEFASIVDGVQCAAEIQRSIAERNADLAADRRIEFRIGVNLGDIIIHDDDVYGDGVNVAARLEGLAKPGEILVSGDAYRQVRAKLKLGFEDLGDRALKNIPEHVRVYRVLTDPSAAGTLIAAKPTPLKRRRWMLTAVAVAALIVAGLAVRLIDWSGPQTTDRVPSLAVMAFKNLTGDPSKEHINDGIADTIITTLSKVSRVFVVARQSSFSFKGKKVTIEQVAKELKVRYVHEGSVQIFKEKDSVRVSVRLLDCASSPCKQVWAERYDISTRDPFTVQNKIAIEVLTALKVKLTEGEQARIHRDALNGNLEVHELYYKGLAQLRRLTPLEMIEARKSFQHRPRFSRSPPNVTAYLQSPTIPFMAIEMSITQIKRLSWRFSWIVL